MKPVLRSPPATVDISVSFRNYISLQHLQPASEFKQCAASVVAVESSITYDTSIQDKIDLVETPAWNVREFDELALLKGLLAIAV